MNTQRIVFDPKAPLREEKRSDPDHYVALLAEKGALGRLDTSAWDGKIVAGSEGKGEGKDTVVGESRDLCFIPYYLRANRGGRGQMRVGLRVL